MTKKVEIVVVAKDKASQTMDNIGKSSKSLANTIKANMGKIRMVSGLVTAGFVAMGKKFFDTAKELELMNKKADVVLGDFRKEVEETAKTVATRMGMTNMEFVTATANIADLLVPMGFARKEAVKMSTDVTKLAGALSEWSNGKYNAKEASEILAKAMLGETEQLKMMGIKIDQTSKAFNERIRVLMEDKGLTLEQAKAMDIQNQIFEKSTDAQKAYAEGAGSLADMQGRLSVQMKNVKETIALALLPLFSKLLETLQPIIDKFATWIQENPKLAKNILLIVAGLSALVLGITVAIPVITSLGTAITLATGPFGIILTAVGLLAIGLTKLFTGFPTYEERVAGVKEQMRLLTEQFNAGIITEQAYGEQMSQLQDKMVQLETQSQTFWGNMRNDLAETFYNIKNTPAFLGETFNAIGGYFEQFAGFVASKIQRLGDTVFGYFTDRIEAMVGTVQQAREKVQAFIGKAKNVAGKVASFVGIGGERASGGSVQAGKAYTVGERGQETFVPNVDGRIVPNGGAGATININMGNVAVNNGQDAQGLANTIANEIKRQTQLYNIGIN